jgi:hypothetical protein
VVLGLELRAFTLSHSTSPIFFVKGFLIGSHGTICLGWLQTAILLISLSWIARITGVSHWRLARLQIFNGKCKLMKINVNAVERTQTLTLVLRLDLKSSTPNKIFRFAFLSTLSSS